MYVIQGWDPKTPGLNCNGVAESKVREWVELQDNQNILTTTPMVVLGYRLRVYRAEGTTQWFSAITSSYNEEARVSMAT